MAKGEEVAGRNSSLSVPLGILALTTAHVCSSSSSPHHFTKNSNGENTNIK